MRRSKSYEVRDPMNIWNKYDFAMSGLGKKSKILAKIKHFFKCVKWSKQRITRGYCDCDVWEMFSFLQTLIPDMLQTLKDTRTGSPGYLGENYTNENGILVNDTCHEEWNCILEEELKRMEEFRRAQAEVEQKKEKPMSQKMLNQNEIFLENEIQSFVSQLIGYKSKYNLYPHSIQCADSYYGIHSCKHWLDGTCDGHLCAESEIPELVMDDNYLL